MTYAIRQYKTVVNKADLAVYAESVPEKVYGINQKFYDIDYIVIDENGIIFDPKNLRYFSDIDDIIVYVNEDNYTEHSDFVNNLISGITPDTLVIKNVGLQDIPEAYQYNNTLFNNQYIVKSIISDSYLTADTNDYKFWLYKGSGIWRYGDEKLEDIEKEISSIKINKEPEKIILALEEPVIINAISYNELLLRKVIGEIKRQQIFYIFNAEYKTRELVSRYYQLKNIQLDNTITEFDVFYFNISSLNLSKNIKSKNTYGDLCQKYSQMIYDFFGNAFMPYIPKKCNLDDYQNIYRCLPDASESVEFSKVYKYNNIKYDLYNGIGCIIERTPDLYFKGIGESFIHKFMIRQFFPEDEVTESIEKAISDNSPIGLPIIYCHQEGNKLVYDGMTGYNICYSLKDTEIIVGVIIEDEYNLDEINDKNKIYQDNYGLTFEICEDAPF